MNGQTGTKLLAVGDSSQNLQSLSEMMQPEGLEVFTAHGPEAGWEAFADAPTSWSSTFEGYVC